MDVESLNNGDNPGQNKAFNGAQGKADTLGAGSGEGLEQEYEKDETGQSLQTAEFVDGSPGANDGVSPIGDGSGSQELGNDGNDFQQGKASVSVSPSSEESVDGGDSSDQDGYGTFMQEVESDGELQQGPTNSEMSHSPQTGAFAGGDRAAENGNGLSPIGLDSGSQGLGNDADVREDGEIWTEQPSMLVDDTAGHDSEYLESLLDDNSSHRGDGLGMILNVLEANFLVAMLGEHFLDGGFLGQSLLFTPEKTEVTPQNTKGFEVGLDGLDIRANSPIKLPENTRQLFDTCMRMVQYDLLQQLKVSDDERARDGEYLPLDLLSAALLNRDLTKQDVLAQEIKVNDNKDPLDYVHARAILKIDAILAKRFPLSDVDLGKGQEAITVRYITDSVLDCYEAKCEQEVLSAQRPVSLEGQQVAQMAQQGDNGMLLESIDGGLGHKILPGVTEGAFTDHAFSSPGTKASEARDLSNSLGNNMGSIRAQGQGLLINTYKLVITRMLSQFIQRDE